MERRNIEYGVRDGVARLVLDRPPVNVLNIEMMEEMHGALEEAAADESAKVLVLQGRGKCFSAGVDVGEHTGELARRMIEVFHGLFRRLYAVPQPTVALVHRSVLGGGCELAAACDMVLASDDITIGQPEIQVGVLPPVAAALFPRSLGTKKAFELIVTGALLEAPEALAAGLVNRVFPAGEFEEASEKIVASLASLSGAVLRITKKAFRAGLHGPDLGGLDAIERIYLDELMQTRDAHEGLQAFLEKRKPTWEDR